MDAPLSLDMNADCIKTALAHLPRHDRACRDVPNERDGATVSMTEFMYGF